MGNGSVGSLKVLTYQYSSNENKLLVSLATKEDLFFFFFIALLTVSVRVNGKEPWGSECETSLTQYYCSIYQ